MIRILLTLILQGSTGYTSVSRLDTALAKAQNDIRLWPRAGPMTAPNGVEVTSSGGSMIILMLIVAGAGILIAEIMIKRTFLRVGIIAMALLVFMGAAYNAHLRATRDWPDPTTQSRLLYDIMAEQCRSLEAGNNEIVLLRLQKLRDELPEAISDELSLYDLVNKLSLIGLPSLTNGVGVTDRIN